MTKRLKPVVLRGRYVTLEPLAAEHVDDLVAAASVDRSSYSHTGVPDGVHAMGAYVAGLLADAEAGLVLPFIQRLSTDGAGTVVGCTRYLDLKWWPTGDRPTEVEIGGTWLGAAAQRTGVNTEAKLLLLSYAFDQLDVWRVAIATDADNARSRAAIERLGATFEGVLRNHRLYSGSGRAADASPYRDTAMYSVIREEWPAVEAHLRGLLSRDGSPA